MENVYESKQGLHLIILSFRKKGQHKKVSPLRVNVLSLFRLLISKCNNKNKPISNDEWTTWVKYNNKIAYLIKKNMWRVFCGWWFCLNTVREANRIFAGNFNSWKMFVVAVAVVVVVVKEDCKFLGIANKNIICFVDKLRWYYY